MRIHRYLVATLLAAASLSAQAGPNWSFVEAGYARAHPDGGPNLDGFGLRGSVAFADQWHLFGRYDDLSDRVDLSRTSLGIGYNLGISDRTDLVARASYERVDASFGGIEADGNGYGVYVGLRGNVSDAFTLGAGVKYTDIEDGNETVFQLDAQYQFTPSWALAFEVEAGDEGEAYFIGPRLTF